MVDFDPSSLRLNWMAEAKNIPSGQPCHSIRLH